MQIGREKKEEEEEEGGPKGEGLSSNAFLWSLFSHSFPNKIFCSLDDSHELVII